MALKYFSVPFIYEVKLKLIHMNMKDTLLLLIFLFSIIGLIIGIYYSEDISSENSHKGSYERIYEDSDGVLTITLEKNEKNDYSKFFT